ncbi:mandelate racemase [Agrobacterium tumefaciens]|uniref:mandelate racemase n=1 Tax=Agrobacterium tumefaciens TaxID=358 RepID=UPI00287F0824|nr:mandelate racemase [Agrobacterium tumefaciens]MDS7594882.1 mandelate racemase [Agrobacterium tumefaciens]
MAGATQIRVADASVFERGVSMRMPFRFGAATVTEARQIFLRLVIEDQSGRTTEGYAAELMVPKWFDKNPALSNADNEAQLRLSLQIAVSLALAAPAASAFGIHASLEPQQHRDATANGLNGLIASFGLALVDRAILDGLCRLNDLPVADAIRANLPGIDSTTTPDLAGFDLGGFLSRLTPQPAIMLRHTVGYIDALTRDEVKTPRRNDGLPECLEDEILAYGPRFFKLKVSGRPTDDAERLKAIARVLDRLPDYKATLDGNEQFESEAAMIDLLDRMEAEPALSRLRQSLLFVEQPFARATALSTSVEKLAGRIAVEIDESDGTPDAFLEARRQGYRGVSSKSCKGFYRSLLNRMRVEAWKAETASDFFMSAEDLTTQAGIALQQDLALASIIGLQHIERNGHHYVDGMQGASPAEGRAWLTGHGDLYHEAQGRPRLTIRNGVIALDTTLRTSGLGVEENAARATFATLQEQTEDAA